MQGEVQAGYFKHAYSFMDQRLLAPEWRQLGYVKQFRAVTNCSSL